MCSRHWRTVSLATQREVRKRYQEGQCTGKVKPSNAWMAYAFLAIAEVLEVEGRCDEAAGYLRFSARCRDLAAGGIGEG